MISPARFAILALLAIFPAAQGARVDGKVRRLLAKSPVAKQGYVGVLVLDENSKRLIAVHADQLFVPASNAKLFTTAFALERLGPDKRFETRVERRGDGLALIGNGDANLSGRLLPYVYHSTSGPALAAIDDLATQIAATGIKEVPGDVIGDDTAFLYAPFAAGWDADDTVDDDGAPVSALVVNDNIVSVHIAAGPADGAPALVSMDPPLVPFAIENHVVTGAPDEIHAARIPQTNVWRIWGALPAGSVDRVERWAVDDPAVFAAAALKYALERRGVKVDGVARASHRYPGMPFAAAAPGDVIARRESQPLIEDLRLTDKISQNLHADLLLSDVSGSRGQGLLDLTAFLEQIGVPASECRLYDGSGLSRLDLVTPDAVVKLLTYMAASPHAEDWMTLLPVSGVDGSLADRLTGPKTRGKIHAKTGSLTHVSALSGYAFNRKGRRLTFSIIVNNASADTAAQRDLIDKICAVLVE